MKSPNELFSKIDGGDYLTSMEASKHFGITNDYITLLCRKNKIEGHFVGRLWYINKHSLQAYLDATDRKRQERNRLLSQQVRLHLAAKGIAAAAIILMIGFAGAPHAQAYFGDTFTPLLQGLAVTEAPVVPSVSVPGMQPFFDGNAFETQTTHFAAIVLHSYVKSVYELGNVQTRNLEQLGTAIAALPAAVVPAHASQNALQRTSLTILPQVQQATLAPLAPLTYGLLAPKTPPMPTLPRTEPLTLQPIVAALAQQSARSIFEFNSSTASVWDAWTTYLAGAVYPTTIIKQPTAPAPAKPSSTSTTIKHVAPAAAITPAVTNTQYVTEATLNAKLQALAQTLRAQFSASAATAPAPAPNTMPFPVYPIPPASLAQRIDQLSNVTITNATLNGVHGLTSSDIPDLSGTYLALGASATTTLNAGINLVTGCVAVNGVCVSNGSGNGITSLGPSGALQSGSTITFASSTSGSDFAITASSNIITFTLPSASASNRGLLTSADWSTFNGKLASSSIANSAALATLISDETGSGVVVFSTNPTLASTTLSGSTLLANATTTSLAITNAANCTGSNALQTNASGNISCGTISGSASSTLLSDSNTFGGINTFSNLKTASANQILYTNNAGVVVSIASSSLNLPNAALQNSSLTINTSGGLTGGGSVSLGGTLSISSFSYLFPNNSTTTGLLLLASSTIGSGAQAGGLTISGGATTTGNFYTLGSTTISSTLNAFGGLYSASSTLGKIFATNATTTSLGITGIGSGALAVTSSGSVYTFATSTWTFASSTLLGDSNTFTGTNTFSNLKTASANQILYTNNAGVVVSVASSSLNLPNSALQNSTISGIALGSNLNSLSHDTTLNGTSYNGSATVSDWGLNLAHGNWWTALQNFTNASTSQLTATSSAYLATLGGSVGIGTTSPATALGVQGSGLFSGNLTAAGLTATGTVAFTGLGSGFVGSNNGTLYTFATSTINAASSTLLSDTNTFSATNSFANIIDSGLGANQFVYTSNTKQLVSVASSSLNLPNAALQNSSISGVSLGSNLNALTFNNAGSGAASGSTYNGSAAVTLSYNSIGAISTTSTWTQGNLAYVAGNALVSSVGTTTATVSNGLTYSGTFGALVGGASGTLGLASISGNSLLGCSGSASCTPGAVATSSLFTGSTGQIGYFASSGGLVGTSTLFIGTNGNVGLGTTSPFADLSIIGNENLSVYASSTLATLFSIASTSNIAGVFSTTTIFSINNQGNVFALGSTTVSGTLNATNVVNIGTASAILSTNSSGAIGALTVGNGLTFSSNTLSTSFGTTSSNIWTALQTLTGGLLVNNASSSVTNLFVVFGTTTNATSTALYVSGSSTVASNFNATAGGALSGTFAGTPTFSGLVTHTGSLLVNNASSSITNLLVTFGTTTNATSTALYVSGSSTVASIFNAAGGGTLAGAFTFAGNLTYGGTAFTVNNPATTTIPNKTYAWSLATSTTAVNQAIISISGNNATSTISLFGATTTGLTSGSGVGLPTNALQNLLIIGNGFVPAGVAVVNGGLCVDNDGWCTASTTGRISSVTSTIGNSDLAEEYLSSDTRLTPGNIVESAGDTSIALATAGSGHPILGIVSTAPGITLGLNPDQNPGSLYPVALAGRVPVVVNLDNGPIAAGDRIALSTTTPGVGMKAGPLDASVGIALLPYDATSTNSTIMVFVTLQKNLEATSTVEALFSSLTSHLTQWFANAQNGIAKLFAGEVHTQKLCVSDESGAETCLTKAQLDSLLSGAAAAKSTSSNTTSTTTPSAPAPADTTPPTITINGDNPAIIHVGDTYSDLGAQVSDNVDTNIGYQTFVNGTLVQTVALDTSTTTAYTIEYAATDSSGNTATSSRSVIVEPAQ